MCILSYIRTKGSTRQNHHNKRHGIRYPRDCGSEKTKDRIRQKTQENGCLIKYRQLFDNFSFLVYNEVRNNLINSLLGGE